MAIIGRQKGSGKRSRVREKSVKSQGILIWIMSGNPGLVYGLIDVYQNNKLKLKRYQNGWLLRYGRS